MEFDQHKHTQSKDAQEELAERLNYTFQNEDLLDQAFTHGSFRSGVGVDQGRLVVLGAEFLRLVVAEAMFSMLPDASEGDLSIVSNSILRSGSLQKVFKKLDLSSELKVGKSLPEIPPRLKSRFVEALIGAIVADGGFESVRKFIMENIIFSKTNSSEVGQTDLPYKSFLHNYLKRKFGEPGTYSIIEELGLAHDRTFVVKVSLREKELGRGSGKNKVKAEQEAARAALKSFSEFSGLI